MNHRHPSSESHHDLGLQADLDTLRRQAARRQMLGWLAGASLAASGAAAWAASRPRPGGGGGGGAGGGSSSSSSSSSSATGGTGNASCPLIAEETAGPYPGDGSNANAAGIANALILSGIVRSDIRSSIAGATGSAQGIPLTLRLKLVNSNGACANLAGYAIYLWHCDREGRYSMYSSGVTAENYLRGVQVTDANGELVFTTIVPGCYAGRMPHMHLEVYRSQTTASQYSNKLRTSQIAFPVAMCSEVYANAAGYGTSVSNFSRISFATDNVFSDGTSTEMATVTGSLAAGYSGYLQIPIAA